MEPPKITISADNSSNASSDVPKTTIRFQCGLLRETETFVGEDLEVLCRDNLLDYACDMLNTKVNIPLADEMGAVIHKFRYNYWEVY